MQAPLALKKIKSLMQRHQTKTRKHLTALALTSASLVCFVSPTQAYAQTTLNIDTGQLNIVNIPAEDSAPPPGWTARNAILSGQLSNFTYNLPAALITFIGKYVMVRQFPNLPPDVVTGTYVLGTAAGVQIRALLQLNDGYATTDTMLSAIAIRSRQIAIAYGISIGATTVGLFIADQLAKYYASVNNPSAMEATARQLGQGSDNWVPTSASTGQRSLLSSAENAIETNVRAVAYNTRLVANTFYRQLVLIEHREKWNQNAQIDWNARLTSMQQTCNFLQTSVACDPRSFANTIFMRDNADKRFAEVSDKVVKFRSYMINDVRLMNIDIAKLNNNRDIWQDCMNLVLQIDRNSTCRWELK